MDTIKVNFVAALVTGIFGIFVPEVLGLGSGPLRVILDGGYSDWYLLLMLVGKLLLTALCIGFGLFGGVFSPALFVGAAAGAIADRAATILVGIAAGPVIAICGMAAVASAVIGVQSLG